MADEKVVQKPGDISAALDRDQGAILYRELNMWGEKTVSGSIVLDKLVEKLEGLGYAMLEATNDPMGVSSSRVKPFFDLVLTRKEAGVVHRCFIAAMTPGSGAQKNIGFIRRKLRPLLEALGMRRAIEKEAYGTKKDEDDDEILTDKELAEQEAEEAREKAEKGEKKESKDLLKKE